MSKRHPRPRRRPQPLPMPDRFEFTERELWRIHKNMMVTTRATACPVHYGADVEQQRYNWHVCRKAVRTLHTGVPTSQLPASALKRIYAAAHAGFNCSCALGRDEATARRSAVVAAATELEFSIGILEHGKVYQGGCDDGGDHENHGYEA